MNHRDDYAELTRDARIFLALRGTSEAADARFASEAPALVHDLSAAVEHLSKLVEDAEKAQEKAEENAAETEEQLADYDRRLTRPAKIAYVLGVLVAFEELLALRTLPPPQPLATVHPLPLRKGPR